MRSTHLAVAALAISLASACSMVARPATDAPVRSRPYVVLISFDGFRHDYLDRYRPPAFASVATRGMRATALIPSFPSKTFPNHYTLATGLSPGHHGIAANAFHDPVRRAWYRVGDSIAVRDARWYGGEPIWVTAERNGVRSAAYFWPGSEAAIGGVRPSRFVAYDGTVPNARRVDAVAGWLRLAPPVRPHLVLLYFSDVDDTTHRHGPDAPNTATAVASVDRALQRLLDSIAVSPLRDSVNVVLVSDHGMTGTPATQVIVVSDLLRGAGVDTTGILFGDNGPAMSLWFGGDSARMHRAKAALTTPHAATYLRRDAPARWRLGDNPRMGDLLVVGELGYTLKRNGTDPDPSAGSHGYDPALPDMRGIFLSAGPGVRPGSHVPAIENVQVYAFLAALLRLDQLPAVDGALGVLQSALR
ncbi:MAG: ectonucleotide pyrophosphatase/phosphodiesterase [Gemmatimonadaceae bacterium]|nr:ectonucleotide pyrophosphatase/phosphodiesterase [Gemmatimonadaceae bacterium]